MSKIFVSYKRSDKEKVLKIISTIQHEINEKCWMDVDEIESDAQFVSVIIKAIEDAEIFLFMYSQAQALIKNYDKDWCIRELNYAHELNKRIVFINIDGTVFISWLKFMFPQKQIVDVSSSDQFNKLIKDIKHWLNINKQNKYQTTNNTETNVVVDKIDRIINKPEKVVKTINVLNEEIRMVKIDKGSFYMGENNNTNNSRLVYINKDYYIAEVPVTQRLWEIVMGENPSRFINPENPVDSVSWNECQLFIKLLNYATGLNFRLPSEAEWEFAARGGLQSHNYLYSGSNNIDDVAWNVLNSSNTTHPVKTKKANELGLFDMSGNIWEWCQDFYVDLNENTILQDLTSSQHGIHHVYKGGCWCELEDCRIATRRAGLANFKSYGGLGFRLALTL